MRVIVTGGLGFIGSHTVDVLVERGFDVVVLDNLEWQVHGGRIPPWINPRAEYVFGDVRDRELLKRILKDVEAVVHLAALVGVGQSMYQVHRYVDVNVGGTAALLDAMLSVDSPVKVIVYSSSMSVYGEGLYQCPGCGALVEPGMRSLEQVKRREWEHKCPHCGSTLKPVPTPETKKPDPQSVYAWTKLAQEQLLLLAGRAYGIRVVALRYFNVYGPRQSLRNPYTGVAAIFIARLLNGRPPLIFEDGRQMRDFVHVRDVARANAMALEKPVEGVFNVGSGRPVTILELAETLAKIMGRSDLKPVVLNRYRVGDVRHCFASIERIREKLGWEPSVKLEEGLKELVEWAVANKWQAEDRSEQALRELEERGLLV